MVRRRKRRAGLLLPWERGVGGVREVLFGRRTRPAAGLLVATAAVLGIHAVGSAQLDRSATMAAIAEVERATHAFVVDMDRCPRSPGELLHPPKTGVHYLTTLPKDAWNQDLHIDCVLEGYPVITVTSAGPSGSLLVDDNLP